MCTVSAARRAPGKAGVAISFCDRDEHKYLRTIERATKQNMSVIVDHPFHAADIASGPGGSARRLQRRRSVRYGTIAVQRSPAACKKGPRGLALILSTGGYRIRSISAETSEI